MPITHYMASEPSRLLALPAELREIVYRAVLSTPSQGSQLLRVCREIYTEARKFLFERPLRLRDQAALYRWLARVPLSLLQHVREIDVDLQDIDLRPLLRPIVAPTVSADHPPRLRTLDLYEEELERLIQALGKLQNVKTLTFRALCGRQSYLYRDYLTKVLNALGALYPRLQSLILRGNFHYQSLEFLRSLSELKALSFDGFSASSPAETSEILSSLQLTHFSLVSQHELLTPTYHQHSSFTAEPQCFTGDVLRAVNPLVSFSVAQHGPTTTRPPALFPTSEILASLHSHKTLSSLSISLRHSPSKETFEALEHYLQQSSIERLELDWQGLDLNTLYTWALLPDSLRNLWVRCTSMAAASALLSVILRRREAAGLQLLWRVVLVRSTSAFIMSERAEDNLPPAQADSVMEDEGFNAAYTRVGDTSPSYDADDASFARTKSELNALGIMVSWCTEN